MHATCHNCLIKNKKRIFQRADSIPDSKIPHPGERSTLEDLPGLTSASTGFQDVQAHTDALELAENILGVSE